MPLVTAGTWFCRGLWRRCGGGNRIQLFGDVSILQFESDYQSLAWQMSDIDTGLAIGGAKLPWEAYFTYGTPASSR